MTSSKYPNRYKGEMGLGPYEIPWSDMYFYLLDRGYQLRERYHPEWIPSWVKDETIDIGDAEDLSGPPYPMNIYVVDATCLRSGKFVMLKETRRDVEELDILTYVSSPELRDDPRNHCLQLLDVFEYPDKPESILTVTPRLHRIFTILSKEFRTVGEVLKFVDHSLVGLDFMHEHNIGHRDIDITNMVMNPKDWFRPGYNNALWANGYRPTKTRSEVDIKYYFLDFGLSSLYPSFDARIKGGEVQAWGKNKDAPELSRTVPYDVFSLDVWCLGRVFQEECLSQYHFLDFLEPLVGKMTLEDPLARPTASEALQEFLKLKPQVDAAIHSIHLRPIDGRKWNLRPSHLKSVHLYHKWRKGIQLEGETVAK